MNVDSIKWGEFKICDLFEVYTGGDLILTNIVKGNIPIVSHSATDNGVSAYTQVIPNRKKFNHKTTISLADRGNFFATAQQIDFYIGTRVKALEAKFTQVNYFILLFICVCINKQSLKFSYGKNCCANTDSLRIILPIDSKGNPNYAFMESCMRKLEQKHLTKIIKYYKNKLLDSNGGGGGIIFATHLILLNLHFAIPILYPAILIFIASPIFCLVILSKAKYPKDITNNPALLQQSKTLQLSLRVA